VRVVQVLVVDDHEPFREAAAAVIRVTPGFAVSGMVSSGEDSISAAHSHQVDLVLMDVNLPGMDGLAAAARLRELDDPPIVVLVSTYDEEEFSDRLAEVGVAGYLAKSRFGADSLVRVWRERLLIGCGQLWRASIITQVVRNRGLQRQTNDEPTPPIPFLRLDRSADRFDPVTYASRGRLWARPADDLDPQLALVDSECGLSRTGQITKALDCCEVGSRSKMLR
jgi:DNA-binding NarL/FixJ family response regulator